jgi:ketosteroid isomerase-like protein
MENTMSSNNLSQLARVARSYWDAEARGDLEEVLSHFTDSATFKAPGYTLSGREEIRKFYIEILDAYAEMRLDMRRVIESGHLLVVEFGFHYKRHNEETGYTEGCNVFTIVDGKIDALQCYFNPAEY